ncbi:hypothetical protein [Haloarcula sp. JP-L23]|uniref:hypothetical protein n=1 Tax=Haloarcula sp. JP-L23 TaxID=2716717 RepID=UPI00140EDA76|nr:hypothetical protein G9465_20905 [Haloarcula sp. JP-L23]
MPPVCASPAHGTPTYYRRRRCSLLATTDAATVVPERAGPSVGAGDPRDEQASQRCTDREDDEGGVHVNT